MNKERIEIDDKKIDDNVAIVLKDGEKVDVVEYGIIKENLISFLHFRNKNKNFEEVEYSGKTWQEKIKEKAEEIHGW